MNQKKQAKIEIPDTVSSSVRESSLVRKVLPLTSRDMKATTTYLGIYFGNSSEYISYLNRWDEVLAYFNQYIHSAL